MRRSFASFRRVCLRRRIGAALALAALFVQLALPGAAALAMGVDPLGSAPICTTASTGTHPGIVPGSHHKALHAACPLCQAPAAAWGFLPPEMPGIAAPRSAGPVDWAMGAVLGVSRAAVASRARGPPGAA